MTCGVIKIERGVFLGSDGNYYPTGQHKYFIHNRPATLSEFDKFIQPDLGMMGWQDWDDYKAARTEEGWPK